MQTDAQSDPHRADPHRADPQREPAGRGHLTTEQRNPRSTDLDSMPVAEVLALINAEDESIAGAVAAALPQIESFVNMTVAALKRGDRLIYIGAGSSGRLGVLDAAECPPTFSTPPEMVVGAIAGGPRALTRSIEGAEDQPSAGEQSLKELELTAGDIVLGITSGGTTPYVHGAIAYARQLGCGTGLLVCTAGAADADQADLVMTVIVGPEVVTGSTRMKAGTATKMVLNMISTASMVQLHKVYGNLMVDLQARNDKLRDRGARIIAEVAGLAYEAAADLLVTAGGEVKTALAMQLLALPAEEARQKLAAVEGSLSRALAKSGS